MIVRLQTGAMVLLLGAALTWNEGFADAPGDGAGAVTTCAARGFDPNVPDEGRILQRYYEATADTGRQGCWVRPHPNGKDLVLTPYTWGRHPAAERLELIRMTEEAIGAARRTLQPFGSLDLPLHVILSDDSEGGIAYWLTDHQCWIESGNGDGTTFTLADAYWHQGIIAHEIGHCFLMQNVPDYSPEAYDNDLDPWWDESGANFVSSLVYPALNKEHYPAEGFDLDGQGFEQPYRAYAMLQSYANAQGTDAVFALFPNLLRADSRAEQLEFLRGIGFGEHYRDFVFDHHHGLVNDPPGDGTLPSESPDGVETFQRIRVEEGATSLTIDPLPGGRLNLLVLGIDAGYRVTIYPPSPSVPGLRGSMITASDAIRAWENPYVVEGSCTEFSVVNVLLTHLEPGHLEGAEIQYDIQPIDSLACPDPDHCEVGLWEEVGERVLSSRHTSEDFRAQVAASADIDIRMLPDGFGFHDIEQSDFPQGMQMKRSYGFAGARLLIQAGGQWSINDPHRIDTEAGPSQIRRNVYFFGEGGNWTSDGGQTLLHSTWERTREQMVVSMEGFGSNANDIDEPKPRSKPRDYALECVAGDLILRGTGARQWVDERRFRRAGPGS